MKTSHVLMASAAISVWSLPALAQAGGAPLQAAVAETRHGAVNIGEIIVTAQMRQERLQDIPLSANALGEQQLDTCNVTDLASNAADVAVS